MTGAGLDTSEAAARALDDADPLTPLRDRFLLPQAAERWPAAYLAGNSLGLQPRTARAAVESVLDDWATRGVEGWFEGPQPWMDLEGEIVELTAPIVGARPGELITANSLTIDLHLLLTAAYRPAGRRTAILIDGPTFPSDRYAVVSHLRALGRDPDRDLITVRPRTGEATLREDDLMAAIREHRDDLAMVLLAGVNYATGQALDVARLTGAAHEAGAIAAWDLAHAAGNVPLALHDADVDVAAWCTYKYMNGGPGAVAQVFIHERLAGDPAAPRLAGWWGNDPATRFEMTETFRPGAGADGFRASTPAMLSLAPIAASLTIFDDVGMAALRARSVVLTAYLESLIDTFVPDASIVTPRDPASRGAQLSVRVADAKGRVAALATHGVIADMREPDIIRLAPAPLYNGYHDAWRAATALAATA